MQVTETLSKGLKRAYTVVVPASDIESKRAARFANLGKTLALPGFRPGKVPLTLVRQRFGTRVSAEVLEESVSEATRQVLSERGLRPAQQPKVDLVSLDVGPGAAKDLEFKVELELLPEVILPDFTAISLTREGRAGSELVDKTLADIARRNRAGEITAQEPGGGAARGSATVDMSGRGREFPAAPAMSRRCWRGGYPRLRRAARA
jgi:trigger factor